MAREQEIIIEVEVNAGESAQKLTEVRTRIDALKDAQKNLTAQRKELNAAVKAGLPLSEQEQKRLVNINSAIATNAADLKQLNAEEKMWTAQLQISTQGNRKYGDSLVEMSAQLAQLKAEYRGLSAAQREGAEGQALQKSIQEMDAAIKSADYSLGDFQRNVGNYASALLGLNGNVVKVANLFAGGFRQGLAAATAALNQMTQELTAVATAAKESAQNAQAVGRAVETMAGSASEVAKSMGEVAGAVTANTAATETNTAATEANSAAARAAAAASEGAATATRANTAAMGGLTGALKTAVSAVKNFSKALLATPLGWILVAVGAVVAILSQLRAAFKRSDEASTALQAAFSKLQPVVTAVRTVFEALAKAAAAVVGAVMGAATAVLNLIPAYRQASAAAQELVTAQDELEERQREYTVHEAERSRQIAELNKKARGDEKLTAKEREEIYKQIDDLEAANMEERRKNAAEAYRIMKERADKTRDTSDEMKNALANAYADMIKAETDYLNQTTRNASRQAQARKEMAAEEEAAAKAQEEAAKRAREASRQRAEQLQREREEAQKTQQAELRALEDLQASMIEDVAEQQRERTRLTYQRQIEDLKSRLESEKNLTGEAREAMNGQVVLLEEKMWKELASIDEEELKRQAEATAKMSEEAAKRASEAAAAAAQATREEQKRLREQYNQEAMKLANDVQERLNAVYGNAAESARIEAQLAEQTYSRLLEMDEATKAAMFANEEEYRAAVLESEAQVLAARQKSAETLQAQAKEVADTMQSVTGALSDLYEAAAGDSETYERFKKAMAIVDATISMAQTIAAATAVSTEGDPYTMAIRIAANVAAVTAQFAAVIKAIRAAQVPSAPGFAEGGIVPGSSYSGDRVSARLNSGEMVINMTDQQRLWELVSGGVSPAGLDYGRLAAAVAEGVAALPSPVLDYSEFTRFERRVKMNEQIAKLK